MTSTKFRPKLTVSLAASMHWFAKSMGTSSALGSVVRAWDVRDVSDQVRGEATGIFGKMHPTILGHLFWRQ